MARSSDGHWPTVRAGRVRISFVALQEPLKWTRQHSGAGVVLVLIPLCNSAVATLARPASANFSPVAALFVGANLFIAGIGAYAIYRGNQAPETGL
jgi:hypothetical protein